MDKQKIIEVVREYCKDEKIDIKESIEQDDVMRLTDYLEDYYLKDSPKDKLIHFNILQRSSDCDYWLEAATYADVKKDEGLRFITIIFDHDAFLSEYFDDLIEDIFGSEEEAQKVLKSLDPVRYIIEKGGEKNDN